VTAFVEAPPAADRDTDIPEHCHPHLSSLARSDQRRWGEAYVRGLVSVPGRKSIRRIAEEILGWRADQCLQQFVNQSTWNWEPVRHSLAQQVIDMIRPRAWVVTEAVFPKNGSSSVGVAKQYVPSAGRVLNCQLGMAVVLAGAEASCPVNWRLLLPPSWDGDEARRTRTHVPEAQQHRPRWHHLVHAIDQMSIGWHLTPAPVVYDATHEPDLEPRLRSLEERGLHYVLRVSPNAPLAGSRAPTCGERTLGEVAALAGRSTATQLVWQTYQDRRSPGARMIAANLPRPDGRPWSPWHPVSTQRQLLAEWPVGQARPKALWLTNLSRTRLPELAGLIALHAKALDSLRDMEDTVGLHHFEGRSFRGWHHHVTLASLAYAYTLRRSVSAVALG
jgi:SRSO17 transposase